MPHIYQTFTLSKMNITRFLSKIYNKIFISLKAMYEGGCVTRRGLRWVKGAVGDGELGPRERNGRVNDT